MLRLIFRHKTAHSLPKPLLVDNLQQLLFRGFPVKVDNERALKYSNRMGKKDVEKPYSKTYGKEGRNNTTQEGPWERTQ